MLLLYSIISLLLTASGLYGVALYATERRTKEIGIRKVNGVMAGQLLTVSRHSYKAASGDPVKALRSE